MSSINNIYIPYIENFHNKEIFEYYKKYYNQIGFNVKKIFIENSKDINYSKIINDLIEKKDEIIIFIDYLIIPKFSIQQSIYLAEKYKAIVKPSNKTFIIDNDADGIKIIESLISDEILDNFNYSNDMYYKTWPLNGAWIWNSKDFNELNKINESIDNPLAYDFDFCYKYANLNKLIFIQADSYKINPICVQIDKNIEFIYNEYLQSLVNLYGTPENIFLYKNEILEKIDSNYIEKYIFDIDKYFSSVRYI